MEYYNDNTLEACYSQRYHCGYDVGPMLPEDAVAMTADGSCVFGASQLSRTDNGDLLATVTDTGADDTAPFSFIKYDFTTSSLRITSSIFR